MTGDGGSRCGGPGCPAMIRRAPTGRPARYCSAACRKAAHRARERQAAAAAAEAARLDAARADAARLWPALEDAALEAAAVDGLDDDGELVGAIMGAAVAGQGSGAALRAALGELHAAGAALVAAYADRVLGPVGALERLAPAYRAAALEAGEPGEPGSRPA